MAALIAATAGAALSLHQRPRIRRRDVEIDGLPEAFDGYRIVQISDLHCGPFASGRRVARWVAAANRLDPDLVAVTGDLIASGSDVRRRRGAARSAACARATAPSRAWETTTTSATARRW